MGPSLFRAAIAASLVLALGACGSSGSHRAASSTTRRSTTTTASTTTTTTTTTAVATTPPTTRAPATTRPIAPATTAPLPFTGTIGAVSAATLGASYHPGCPVGPASLRELHLSYWGFDDAPHIGTLVVNAAVASAVVGGFERVFRARFPIRRMVPVSAYDGSDDASMAADNTSGFNCRFVQGTTNWSEHSYGEAIDVNTVENPYLTPGRVQPPAGAVYLDRSPLRAGMAGPGSALNAAFAAIGWAWGGNFHSPDYQHFSANGR